MIYDPPSETNWVYVHSFDKTYAEAYDEGQNSARCGHPPESCPYRESGHERDTTYQNELNYWWHHGFEDYTREEYNGDAK